MIARNFGNPALNESNASSEHENLIPIPEIAVCWYEAECDEVSMSLITNLSSDGIGCAA
jgi:hypothetical protein